MSNYVELHARSAFSFLRGASLPETLAQRAAQAELAGLAVCDRNGVYGAPRVWSSCQESGVRPLVGAELWMEDESVVPVLVRSQQGYRNLCQLLTETHLRSQPDTARVLWSELQQRSDGLLSLTGDEEGPVMGALWRGDRAAARAGLERLLGAFGTGNVWAEVQRHHVRGEDRVVRETRELAAALGVQVVATNGVRYATTQGREVEDVFTCLRHGRTLDEAGRLLNRNAEHAIKGEQEMRRLFADMPEAITNTRRVAEELEFTLDNLGYRFPSYPVAAGESEAERLHAVTWQRARSRYGSLTPAVQRQLQRELELISRLGFSGYFLVVMELVDYAREHGILAQGRGSAANSAVCYALGITAVDPVGCDLLFERFLSEGRRSWPDIDIDFPSGPLREQVIQHVYDRYGRRGAAMTANVICYRGRSTFREVGKVLGLPVEVLDRFSDLHAAGDFEHTLGLEEHILRAGLPRQHPRFEVALRLFEQINGLPRHLGQHSGGMVIAAGELDRVVPIQNAAMTGRTVVQWDKDDCDELGIIKVDLLGLGMMAVLQECQERCAARGRPIDLAQLPKDDVATYDLMCAADTVGTFQVESRAQMATLPRMQPRCFYDVAIQVSLVRPGPIVGELTHPYLARRNGEEPVRYLHPAVEPVLKRTLGVPLFQEQMLKMAMILADFTADQAEELRRAIGFKRNPERLQRVLKTLREQMTQRGIPHEAQEEMVQATSSFALYGFPESHAVSFALIAYASCWLKVHRAPEFYCALLNQQPMGFYGPATLIRDGRRRGVRFRSVSVVHSQVTCSVENDGSVRLGLCYVRGLSERTMERIVQAREQAGQFSSLEEFLRRVPLSRDERRQLARVGALRELAPHRRAALWEVEGNPAAHLQDLWSSPAAVVARDASAPQPSPLREMEAGERWEADMAGTGVTVGPHAMQLVRKQRGDLWRAGDLAQARCGTTVRIGGTVICRQRPGTAKGHVFISLEDETGIANAIVYRDLFEKERLTITQASFLEIDGHVQGGADRVMVVASAVRRLRVGVTGQLPSHDFR